MSVPGASAVVVGGVVAYATRIKAQVLGVDARRLERTGPVDGEVAKQMASGVAALMGAFEEAEVYDETRFPATSGEKRRLRHTKEG